MSYIRPEQLKQRVFDQSVVNQLVNQGLSPLHAQLLAQRGIHSTTDLKQSLKELPHWSQLKGIHEASQALVTAILEQKKIVIIADYDADGATACAVAVRALRQLGARVDYVVPNRMTMGYGLTPEVVNLAVQKQGQVLVTVDNGIASIKGVEYANQLGLTVIITDHHLPGDTLPKASAIVNPNQPFCPFPAKALAGVGVIFYVMLAVRHALKAHGVITEETQPHLAKLLDLVALGTIADLASLDADNRLLVQEGLNRIRQGSMQPGIKALLQLAGKDFRRIQSNDLGFALGPRINAAGRMDDMTVGIECLITERADHALLLAEQLNNFNQDRKFVEESMQQNALEQLDTLDIKDQLTLSLYNEAWHPGVVGLVASRLKEKYHRPVFAFANNIENSTIRGSGRSIPGFHLRDALDIISKRYPNVIERFGGHAAAAGASIYKDQWTVFSEAFEEVAKVYLNEEAMTQTVFYDSTLNVDDITLDLAELCEQEVWGQNFPNPLFMGEFLIQEQRLVGEKHSKLVLTMGEKKFQGIYFKYSDPLPKQIRLLFRVTNNEWNGRHQLQLEINHWCHV
ncbi:MAG: single-stranded-DNA-specific exonuclease RecJ [Ferrovum sp. 37-45-19]|nr:MAG: single-stranded-DNA-specific exonuclease RecJ [Ferrovum sp. 37-45-19]OZB31499.1 MAG: single-stranded-DNA-specific exonuclease RecJ [Ferrovum sp. 34-44-207]HQT81246.1 single-stranded-DNA-specific exonuclease RecJ [Ferrovaceae bacterium]